MRKNHLHVHTGDSEAEPDRRYNDYDDVDVNDIEPLKVRGSERTPRKRTTREKDAVQPVSPAGTCETQESYDDDDDDDDRYFFRSDDADNDVPNRSGRRHRRRQTPTKSTKHASDDNGKDPAVVVIEHRSADGKSSKSGGMAAARTMGRPMKMIIGMALLLSTGGFAYFFKEWFRIPGLETQIQRLEKEVDRLSGEVDRLSSEVDRYEGLNAQLNATIVELDSQNDRLEASNEKFQALNKELNSSVVELKAQNEVLSEQNDVFNFLNDNLNITTIELATEVRRLERAVDELEEQNEGLAFLVGNLRDETEELASVNVELRDSVTALESQVGGLSSEVDRLEELNRELSTIVSFLDEEGREIQNSFDSVTSFLTTEIAKYRTQLVRDTQMSFTNDVDHWDCLYYDVFGQYAFTADPTSPIGPEHYERVMSYVENQVLSQLCLSRQDFEFFLGDFYTADGRQPPVTVSTDDVVGAIGLYTTFAMDHYFPRDPSNGGLTEDEWASYSYSCETIPEERRYKRYT